MNQACTFMHGVNATVVGVMTHQICAVTMPAVDIAVSGPWGRECRQGGW